MMGSLQGQLDDKGLAHLLEYLSMNSNSGCLQLRNAKLGTGKVYFQQGRIVHAEFADHEGIAALSQLLLWQSGRFIFRNNVSSEQESIRISLTSLLREASYQAGHGHSLPEYVTSRLDMRSVLRTSAITERIQTVSLTFDGLQLVREFDGQRDLATIARTLTWPEAKALMIAQLLLEQEIVTIMGDEPVDKGLIRDLNQVLVLLIGPMGQLIISDALAAIGAGTRGLRKNQVSALVTEISQQLGQHDWQTQFAQEAKRIANDYRIDL
jgi:hypothetical protein